MDSSPRELELTPDLLEYAKAVAIKEAPNHCGPHISYDDVVQDVQLRLLRRPPTFDPSRGASAKTLIYTIVKRAVMKFATRETKQIRRFRPLPTAVEVSEGLEEGTVERTRKVDLITERRTAALTRSRWNLDDILQYVDNEDSRALCRLVIECHGNVSEAARRLKLSEGTVRYRLKLLEPKLRAAGFGPVPQGGAT